MDLLIVCLNPKSFAVAKIPKHLWIPSRLNSSSILCHIYCIVYMIRTKKWDFVVSLLPAAITRNGNFSHYLQRILYPLYTLSCQFFLFHPHISILAMVFFFLRQKTFFVALWRISMPHADFCTRLGTLAMIVRGSCSICRVHLFHRNPNPVFIGKPISIIISVLINHWTNVYLLIRLWGWNWLDTIAKL